MKKPIISKCDILGTRIAAVNMSVALRFIKNNLKELKGNYICISNVHTTVMTRLTARSRTKQCWHCLTENRFRWFAEKKAFRRPAA